MSPAQVLAELTARRIIVLPREDGWTLRGPREALARLVDTETGRLREALTWRRMAMAATLPPSGGVPLLRARPEEIADPGWCWSCCDEPTPMGARCGLCALAAGAALAAAGGR